MIRVKGLRLLLKVPDHPLTKLANDYSVTWKLSGPLLLPETDETQKGRAATEWVIVSLGDEGSANPRSRLSLEKKIKVPDELKPGMHVLVDNRMGFKELKIQGVIHRIMSAEDVLCIIMPE